MNNNIEKTVKVNKAVYLGSVSLEDVTKKKTEFTLSSLQTLDNPDSVINVFCEQCHSVIEVNQHGAESLATSANLSLPNNLDNKYFITSSCLYCQIENNPDGKVSVILENTPLN